MAPNDTNPNPATAGANPEGGSEPILDVEAINAAVAASVDNEIKQQEAESTPAATEELSIEANPSSVNIDATPVPEEAPAEEPVSGEVDFNASETAAPADAPGETTDTPAENAAEKPSEAGFVDGDLADGEEKKTEEKTEPPVVAENVVTAPGAKKTNRNLFIALAAVAILAIIVIAIVVIMSL